MKTFYILLCAVLSLQVGASIWYLVTFYRTRGQTLEDCLNGSTDTKRIAYCDALDVYKRVPQGVMIASVIVPIIFQACMWPPSQIHVCLFSHHSTNLDACYIVYQYSKRLENQKIESLRSSRTFVPPAGPAYQPVKPIDESYPLTQPTSHYPYADAPNSFGHTHNKSLGGYEASQKV